jgi:hypothetical protein
VSETRLKVVGHGASTGVRQVGDWDGRPLEGIRHARQVAEATEKVLRDQVRRARTSGCSWADIGEALGITKQTAWERFSNESTVRRSDE